MSLFTAFVWTDKRYNLVCFMTRSELFVTIWKMLYNSLVWLDFGNVFVFWPCRNLSNRLWSRADVAIFRDIWNFANIFWKICCQNRRESWKCTTSTWFDTLIPLKWRSYFLKCCHFFFICYFWQHQHILSIARTLRLEFIA